MPSATTRIEAVLSDFKNAPPHPAGLWHTLSPSLVSFARPDEIAAFASQLSNEFDRPQLTKLINSEADNDIVTLRRLRRRLLIARDAIFLVSRTPDSSQSLSDISGTVGKIVDGDRSSVSLRQAVEVVGSLELIELDQSDLVDANQLVDRFNNRLHTDKLVPVEVSVAKAGGDHAVYHSWRKDFRRVADLIAVIAAIRPDDQTLQSYAAQGLSLNHLYGDLNNTIPQQPQTALEIVTVPG
jgi:hypothetical protein